MSVFRAILVVNLFWLVGMASCASESITTWLVTPDKATPPECLKYAAFNHKTSSVNQAMTLLQAQGYRCYSPQDDTAWHTRLAICEASQ